jgi:hypothetical protein
MKKVWKKASKLVFHKNTQTTRAINFIISSSHLQVAIALGFSAYFSAIYKLYFFFSCWYCDSEIPFHIYHNRKTSSINNEKSTNFDKLILDSIKTNGSWKLQNIFKLYFSVQTSGYKKIKNSSKVLKKTKFVIKTCSFKWRLWV